MIENRFKGITIGLKSEIKDVIIEVPLYKEKNFIILNTNLIQEDGHVHFVRKVFEIVSNKKLKLIFGQRYLV